MDESQMYHKVVLAMVVEILHQVGFEKANKQALQVLVDLAKDCIDKRLTNARRALEEACGARNLERAGAVGEREEDAHSEEKHSAGEREGAGEAWEDAGAEEAEIGCEVLDREKEEMDRVLQRLVVEECMGSRGSYKREELVSFLGFQINITKQIKKDGSGREGSLLEALRIGDDEKEMECEKSRGLVDFIEKEEETNKEPEERKYLDQDVRDYLKIHPGLALEKKEAEEEEGCLDFRIISINKKKKEFLNREYMRDYEYMINRKRLTSKYWTPCEATSEISFLEDLLVQSAVRKVKKGAKEDARHKGDDIEEVAV